MKDPCGTAVEILVLGGGPAGATAALFAARIGRSVTVLAGDADESLIARNPQVDNFPGSPAVSGSGFLDQVRHQCLEAGVTWICEKGTHLSLENRRKLVRGSGHSQFAAQALIIATGSSLLKPDIPRLGDFWGKGVATCVWCDSASFKNRRVAIWGGGNTAFGSAGILARTAETVFLLLPPGKSGAFPSFRKKLQELPNVRILTGIEILGLDGNDRLRSIHLRQEGLPETLAVEGLFIAAGQKPNSDFLHPVIELSRNGLVLADAMGKTNVPGIFAAGDITEGQFRQLIVACGSGANAALSAEEYLASQWI